MAQTTRFIGPLVVWTVLVWGSRIRNIWADDELSTGGQWIRTGIAVLFLAFGVLLARLVWRGRRGASMAGSDDRILVAAVVWTIGFWLVRGIGIIVDDHTTSFTLIHTALMVASIGLALLAMRARTSTPASISSSRLAAR